MVRPAARAGEHADVVAGVGELLCDRPTDGSGSGHYLQIRHDVLAFSSEVWESRALLSILTLRLADRAVKSSALFC
ncbi:hypothetical protein RE9427_47390 [Prescottella equi]|nr:hypothetical protein RE9427_47390 [Prescottella equi]